jgi:ribulose-phosphate 3-epimerase
MTKKLISASILSADFGCLAQDTAAVLKAGADWLHIDVMDNHYVPNLTFGPLICEALHRHLPNAFLDVHLMVQPVSDLIERFAQAGAKQISFHPEASQTVQIDLQRIRQLGCKAGLAINPATPLSIVEDYWPDLDFLLLMSVHPGFAAQRFLPEVLSKISAAKQHIKQQKYSVQIGVDGGVNQETITHVAQAGADVLIMGSALFKTPSYSNTVKQFRAALAQGGY